MKVIALLPICLFILGCASDRQPPKIGRGAPASEVAGSTLNPLEFVSPEARAAIRQLRVGMSEFEVYAIMRPVSQTWHRQPSYTEPGSAELYFGISPTQELPLHVSLWKIASIGPLVPAEPPRVFNTAFGNFN
jgi:hypothetical protein